MVVRRNDDKLARAARIESILGLYFSASRVPAIALEFDGSFVAANAAAIRRYGYPLEQLLTMRIHDFQASERSIDADLAGVVRGEDVSSARRPHKTSEGAILWVAPHACTVHVEGEPLIISTLSEVTSLVLVEERAHRERLGTDAIWREAIERANFGVALIDPGLTIIRVNAPLARMLGTSRESIVGQHCYEALTTCRDRPCPHEEAMRRGEAVLDRALWVAGAQYRVDVVPAGVGGASVGTLHLVYDVSAEDCARLQFVMSTRLATIGRLASAVAHEVSNPAAFVTLALDIIRKRASLGQANTDETLQLIDETRTSVLEINRIVRDLTTFARDGAATRFDLSALATSAVRLSVPEIQGSVAVTLDAPPGVFVHAHGGRIAHAVLNLLTAVAWEGPERRTSPVPVRVTVASDDAHASITIEAATEVDFDGDSRLESRAGLLEEMHPGLGIWLSRAIIEAEGGGIACAHPYPGRSVCVIRLPLAEGAIAASTPTRSTAGMKAWDDGYPPR